MKKYKSENKEFLQEDLDNFMDKETDEMFETVKINGIKYPIHTIKYPEFLAVKLQQCYKLVQIAQGDIGFSKETEQPAEVIELKYKELNEAKIEYEAVKKTIESLEKIDDREDIAFNFLILKMLGETRDLLYNRIDERVNSLEEDIKKDTKYRIKITK